MDKLKINKASSKGSCSNCTRYQRQIAGLKRAFIQADDENVRHTMQYEATINRLKAEHNSQKSKRAGVGTGRATRGQHRLKHINFHEPVKNKDDDR